jgi:hypothetical protein
MKINLGKEEVLLKGEDMLGKSHPGETTRRIDYLTENVLKKINTCDGGWIILYLDESDGRYWELFYPEANWKDFGPPSLRHIPESEAKEKYQLK